jgi:hypothetical protein
VVAFRSFLNTTTADYTQRGLLNTPEKDSGGIVQKWISKPSLRIIFILIFGYSYSLFYLQGVSIILDSAVCILLILLNISLLQFINMSAFVFIKYIIMVINDEQ